MADCSSIQDFGLVSAVPHMILFPRPRIFFLVACALALPTYGISLAAFYFFIKRPYDSKGVNAILATSQHCLRTGLSETLHNVNRAAIERTFAKFGSSSIEAKYGPGVPFIRWGVLEHPMINDGKPFSRPCRTLQTRMNASDPGRFLMAISLDFDSNWG